MANSIDFASLAGYLSGRWNSLDNGEKASLKRAVYVDEVVGCCGFWKLFGAHAVDVGEKRLAGLGRIALVYNLLAAVKASCEEASSGQRGGMKLGAWLRDRGVSKDRIESLIACKSPNDARELKRLFTLAVANDKKGTAALPLDILDAIETLFFWDLSKDGRVWSSRKHMIRRTWYEEDIRQQKNSKSR